MVYILIVHKKLVSMIGNFKMKIIEDLKKEFGIDVTDVIEMGILHPDDAKKWLVKQLYFKWAKEDRTYTEIKEELSETYGISVSSIEKMVYRK